MMMAEPELDATSKMYENLYNIMINKFFAEDYDGADKMASSLLLKADLPLIYRVWCHMILGSAGAGAVEANKQHTNFLGHAQSAVDLINDSKENGVEFPEKILKRATQILEHAKEAMSELEEAGAFAEAAEEEEDVGGDAAETMDIDQKEVEKDAQDKNEEAGMDTDEQQQQDLRTAAAGIAGTSARTGTGLVTPASSRNPSWKENTAASSRERRNKSRPDRFKPG